MTRRPRLLDGFCGGGGAGMGYYRAGFDVVGVDIEPQPRYPFPFLQADMLEVLADPGLDVDVIHVSPPCQGYSRMSGSRPGLADTYPKLIEPVRELLEQWGGPYVIENVPTSPLREPITLCAFSFGYPMYRHRLFESNRPLAAPAHRLHETPASKAGHWRPGTFISVAGNCAPIRMSREAMGIDWMNRNELSEAIPPAYAEHIGRQLIEALR